MLREQAQGINREQVRRLQRRLDTPVPLVRQLATDGTALPLAVVQEAEGFATLSATPLEPLLDYNRRPLALVHRKMVSD